MGRGHRVELWMRGGLLALLGALCAATGAEAAAPQGSDALEPEIQAQLRELDGRVLHGIKKGDCQPPDCTLLVTNFEARPAETMPPGKQIAEFQRHCPPLDCSQMVTRVEAVSGETSALGMQLADFMAQDLASRQTDVKIIERCKLQDFLMTQRIGSSLLTDQAMRWLGTQLGATAVLVGKIDTVGSSTRLAAQVLYGPREGQGPLELAQFQVNDFENRMRPTEPFSAAPPDIRRPGDVEFKPESGGMSPPKGIEMPDPDYTDDARIGNFSGSLTLMLRVSVEGLVTEVEIVAGAPYGLNEKAIRSVRTWKLDPGKVDGKPVAMIVPAEVTFRLFGPADAR